MTKPIDAEIVLLDKDFDTISCTHYWRATLFFEEEPNLKMGKCKVIQDGK